MDAEEDARYGKEQRGDELPEGMRTREERIEEKKRQAAVQQERKIEERRREENAKLESGETELFIATTKDWKQRKAMREAPPPRRRIPNGLSTRERIERGSC